jgi:hypothetical protein
VTLLLDLVLLGNGKRVATVEVTLPVVRARTVVTSAAARREETDGASIVSRAATLLLVVGRREGDRGTNGLKIGRVNVVP